MTQKVENLIVDTTAFIQNAPLHEIATNIITVQEVVDEITSKRQLRRLCVLPYDLVIKDVFPENIQTVTDFSKKTGDYPSLSATDIKVMALTYQLEKEKVGIEHLRTEPIVNRMVSYDSGIKIDEKPGNISGFYLPEKDKGDNDDEIKNEGNNIKNEVQTEEKEIRNTENKVESEESKNRSTNDDIETKMDGESNDSTDEGTEDLSTKNIDKELIDKFGTLDCGELEDTIEGQNVNDILPTLEDEETDSAEENSESGYSDDDDDGWITPSNVQKAKKQMKDDFLEDKPVVVACITTDFAMQNVLKQMNLNISALDGRIIKQIRTFILRCYTCFKTTSKMEKVFCPKCGNKTLKKVAVSLDENGKQVIHINAKKPLTARGKKFSLPTFKGGKHSNNPIICEDQPVPQQRPSRQARMTNNPLDPDYTAGFSPFVMRDVNSRSALLGIRPDKEVKYWMRKNPNESRRRKK